MTYIREKFTEAHLQLPFGGSSPPAANRDLVARAGFALAFRGYRPLRIVLRYYRATNQQKQKEMVRVAGVEPSVDMCPRDEYGMFQ
jgi:hypothetical protein